jgi:cysteine desulfurase family protein
VSDSARIIFTHSATESLNMALRDVLEPGDHIITTSMEHNSLARPLHAAAGQGVEVSRVSCGKEGVVAPAELAHLLRPNTRLVALAHCSNVTGAIQPIAEIGRLVRGSGALLLVDAAQSAGMIPLDVKELGIDLLAVPGHKGLFGPPGTGLLYIAEGIELTPLLVGGTGGSSADAGQPTALPERYESGTLNTPGIAGLAAGVAFIETIGIDRIRRHEEALVAQLLEGLQGVPWVLLHGPLPPAERGGLLSFTVAGVDPARIGFALDQDHEISVRVGLHCAPDAHRTIGTYPGGTVRVSPGWFTTPAEIDSFLQALRTILKR